MTSKVHLAFFLLFACCVMVPPLKIINLQDENGEQFSQNGPSYTYEMR